MHGTHLKRQRRVSDDSEFNHCIESSPRLQRLGQRVGTIFKNLIPFYRTLCLIFSLGISGVHQCVRENLTASTIVTVSTKQNDLTPSHHVRRLNSSACYNAMLALLTFYAIKRKRYPKILIKSCRHHVIYILNRFRQNHIPPALLIMSQTRLRSKLAVFAKY